MYPWSDQGPRRGAALLAHQATFGCIVRTPLPPWPLYTLTVAQLPPRGGVPVGVGSSIKDSAEYEGRHPPNLARKLVRVGNGSLPPIVPISLTAADVAVTRANDKNTVGSIASTWALVAGPAHIEIRDRLLQMHRQRPAPSVEHAGQETPITKPRIVDHPSFRPVKGLEMAVIPSDVDRVGPEAEGLSPIEEEFEGIGKFLDGPLLDLPSPTDAEFGVLTSTPAKIRDRLIQTRREHARSSANGKGNEVESLGEAEENKDSEAIGVIQDPQLNKSSSTQKIDVPLAQPPKRRDSHGNTNITVNSGSNVNKVTKEVPPPEKLALNNDENTSFTLLSKGALTDGENADLIHPTDL
ncbi:hypothetical protein PLEOSDRAFT_1084763 [Pleurotus ostreatus PC15]|uniref:Uncharacterized protein n=1 Tax=Pleurotus ostreatus (strain PC15) TaxID=1137138 RepID=A0A067NU33_PLEO1|nr:hypothetical protein PLEOSDRAFT_1084763 [Pleurotus ostreatus PC15]